MFQGCFGEVSRVFQGRLRGVPSEFQENFKQNFKSFSKMFNGVLVGFQAYFERSSKGV